MTGLRPVAIGIGVLGLSCAQGGAPQATPSPTATAPAVQAQCNGAFSDGTSINVANPVLLADVPGSQQFCDFHTFAWNQFLYLTNGSPQFLSMAPWYNLLLPNGSPAPAAYPGGSTELQGGQLDKQQAGDADQLVDVAGASALYDIRVNQAYYDSLVAQNLYTYTLYSGACAPGAGAPREPALAPPNAATTDASIEIKPPGRLQEAAPCPASTYYCAAAWAWWGSTWCRRRRRTASGSGRRSSTPERARLLRTGSDSPIRRSPPAGTPWSFFRPKTVPPSVMSTQTSRWWRDPAVQQPTPRRLRACCSRQRLPHRLHSGRRREPGELRVKTAPPGQHLPNDQANNPGTRRLPERDAPSAARRPWQNYSSSAPSGPAAP